MSCIGGITASLVLPPGVQNVINRLNSGKKSQSNQPGSARFPGTAAGSYQHCFQHLLKTFTSYNTAGYERKGAKKALNSGREHYQS
jgi:hypothetical protein